MQTTTQQYRFADRVGNVPVSFIREILKAASQPGLISFAGGLPNPTLFPVAQLAAASEKVLKQAGQSALQYSVTEGHYPLRQYISERYRQRQGLNIPPEQILITNGSQQALDLIGKIFINPGDDILMERPTYLGALQCFSMFQPSFSEAVMEEDGVATDQVATIMKEKNMKLFYTIPNFQNPTGISCSTEKRKYIADLFRSYNAVIIEDDPYGDIFFNEVRRPSIKYFNNEQTILLGSFSKIVAPGMRLGWIAAEKEIIEKLTIMKQASDLHSNFLSQRIMYQFLCDYVLDDHIAKIRVAYRIQKNSMIEMIKKYFPAEINYTNPDGGMFLWITLPEYMNARDVLADAMKEKIIFVPGDAFYVSNAEQNTLRMNFSNVEEGAMEKAISILGNIFKWYVLANGKKKF